MRTLSTTIAADLRDRIARGEWVNGDRLPGEMELAEAYDVSRATIRTALQDLGSRGLTVTRRGAGTFVTGQGGEVRADLRHLDSLTATIRDHGREPSVTYRSIRVRPATGEELERLGLPEGSEVLATERSLAADAELVAFSHDVVPRHLLGSDFSVTEVVGSLFELLEGHGLRAVSAVTEVRAVHDPEVGWGERPDDPTYLLLDQVHHDHAGAPLALARTHFVAGRFNWGLVRHR